MRQGDHPPLPSILADSGDPPLPSILADSGDPPLPWILADSAGDLLKRGLQVRACARENPRKWIMEARPGARRR
jgi:hypothetical protein